jgi:two-component system, NarL family, sensor kinase
MVFLDSIALAKACADEIRTMSYLLHPPTLDQFGLVSAIAWYVKGFSQRSGIEVQLEMPADVERLPRDVEIALFRVVQQSLSNVRQHSGSSSAKIQMQIESQQVSLTVSDHGTGIRDAIMSDEDEEPTILTLGVGIAGMRERVRQLGGELQVESQTDQGTTVTVILPLAHS